MLEIIIFLIIFFVLLIISIKVLPKLLKTSDQEEVEPAIVSKRFLIQTKHILMLILMPTILDLREMKLIMMMLLKVTQTILYKLIILLIKQLIMHK